jgi:hypothetical protein
VPASGECLGSGHGFCSRVRDLGTLGTLSCEFSRIKNPDPIPDTETGIYVEAMTTDRVLGEATGFEVSRDPGSALDAAAAGRLLMVASRQLVSL